MTTISQRVDELLATHWLSEDGCFVPYPTVTTGNALTLQEALKEEERIYANLVRRKEETRRRNAEETGNAIDALVEVLQSIADAETWERVLNDYRNDPYGDGWADGVIRYEQDGAAYAAWLEHRQGHELGW